MNLRLFSLSLNHGICPDIWKFLYLYCVHKSGEISNVEHYKGICQQSAIPEIIIDKLISKQWNATTGGIICRVQHGFCQSVPQILTLEYQHLLTESMELGFQVHSIYTGYPKDFNRVDHSLLLAKLSALNITDMALRELESVLLKRLQCLKIYNFHSNEFLLPSGVPLGCHCWPVLCKLFSSIVGDFLPSKYLFFADDLKIYRTIKNNLTI